MERSVSLIGGGSSAVRERTRYQHVRIHRVKTLPQSVVVQASVGERGAEKHEWDADYTA